jgi:hypothetical protein
MIQIIKIKLALLENAILPLTNVLFMFVLKRMEEMCQLFLVYAQTTKELILTVAKAQWELCKNIIVITFLVYVYPNMSAVMVIALDLDMALELVQEEHALAKQEQPLPE